MRLRIKYNSIVLSVAYQLHKKLGDSVKCWN